MSEEQPMASREAAAEREQQMASPGEQGPMAWAQAEERRQWA